MSATGTGAARFPTGTFTPRPGRAPAIAMVVAAAGQELRVTLRNGEQLLLALIIPLAALVGLATIHLLDLPEPRIDTATPGVLALAVMSAAFTSQAITTAFDRRYGVLKRLAAAGFPRWLLIAGKCGATAVVVLGQFAVLCGVALLLGWSPRGNPLWAIVAALLGVAAFIGIGLLLGGTLRAETVLGLANVLWLAMVVVGGVIVPLASGPGWLRAIGSATPAGALSEALRDVLAHGAAPALWSLAVLAGWTLVGWAGAVRWFRWQ